VTGDAATLDCQLGYVNGRPPRDRGFRSALEDEIERLREFLRSPGDGVQGRRRG
jgi:hypothetical protein